MSVYYGINFSLLYNTNEKIQLQRAKILLDLFVKLGEDNSLIKIANQRANITFFNTLEKDNKFYYVLETNSDFCVVLKESGQNRYEMDIKLLGLTKLSFDELSKAFYEENQELEKHFYLQTSDCNRVFPYDDVVWQYDFNPEFMFYGLTGKIDGKTFFVIVDAPMIQKGTLRYKIDSNNPTEAVIEGLIGADSFLKIIELSEKHPEVKTLVFKDVPGTSFDAMNIHLSYLIRELGYETVVPEDGRISSGGVTVFSSGAKRKINKNYKEIGVHSFAIIDPYNPENTVFGNLLPQDHELHQDHITLYNEMLGDNFGKDFYFFSINAADTCNIHNMSQDEIKKYNLAEIV